MADKGGPLHIGVVFDFDGTLVDDVDTLFDAARSVFRATGFEEAAQADFEALRDVPPRRMLEEIHVPLRAVPRLARRLRREMKLRLDDIELADDMRQLIRTLHGSGFTLGIMSSNSPSLIRDVIDRAGVTRHFDFVARGGGVRDRASRLRRVVRRRSTRVPRWVYVGDEIRDFEASKVCGIPFVGVGWGVTSVEAFTAAGARLVAEDLAALEVTLERLRSDGPPGFE
jgi:phosphoglycolate phosphatase